MKTLSQFIAIIQVRLQAKPISCATRWSSVLIVYALVTQVTSNAVSQVLDNESSALVPTTAQAKSPAEIVTQFLEAIQKGDHNLISELIHPNIEWMQPGSNRVSGIKKTSAEVFAMAKLMSELSAQTIRLREVKSITVNGNSVACVLHWSAAQPIGRVLDVDNIDVYTVEDGKIVRVKIFSGDLEQEDKFWGK